MTLLAIDPGRAVKPSIGWATFDADQRGWDQKGELTFDQFVDALELLNYGKNETWLEFSGYLISEVVIENFINTPRSRGGQTNGTSEVIGAVEFACLKTKTPFTRQPNTILPVAKLQAGYVDTHKHLPHQDAAFLHGYYYLVGKGVLQSKGLEATL